MNTNFETNLDRIKAMNPTEFAEFLEDFCPSDAWFGVKYSAEDGNENAKALMAKRENAGLDTNHFSDGRFNQEAIRFWLNDKYDKFYFYDTTDADWGEDW